MSCLQLTESAFTNRPDLSLSLFKHLFQLSHQPLFSLRMLLELAGPCRMHTNSSVQIVVLRSQLERGTRFGQAAASDELSDDVRGACAGEDGGKIG